MTQRNIALLSLQKSPRLHTRNSEKEAVPAGDGKNGNGSCSWKKTHTSVERSTLSSARDRLYRVLSPLISRKHDHPKDWSSKGWLCSSIPSLDLLNAEWRGRDPGVREVGGWVGGFYFRCYSQCPTFEGTHVTPGVRVGVVVVALRGGWGWSCKENAPFLHSAGSLPPPPPPPMEARCGSTCGMGRETSNKHVFPSPSKFSVKGCRQRVRHFLVAVNPPLSSRIYLYLLPSLPLLPSLLPPLLPPSLPSSLPSLLPYRLGLFPARSHNARTADERVSPYSFHVATNTWSEGGCGVGVGGGEGAERRNNSDATTSLSRQTRGEDLAITNCQH